MKLLSLRLYGWRAGGAAVFVVSPASLPSWTTVAAGTSPLLGLSLLKGLLLARAERLELFVGLGLARAGLLRCCDHCGHLLVVAALERDDAGVRVLEVLVELDELIALAQVPHLVVTAVLHLREVERDLEQRARHPVGHLDPVDREPEDEREPGDHEHPQDPEATGLEVGDLAGVAKHARPVRRGPI